MIPPAIVPHALSAFQQIVGDATNEVIRDFQAPDAMVGTSMPSAMPLATPAACHGLIDVKLPTGLVPPMSLYLVAIADSGDRKTSAGVVRPNRRHSFLRA